MSEKSEKLFSEFPEISTPEWEAAFRQFLAAVGNRVEYIRTKSEMEEYKKCDNK